MHKDVLLHVFSFLNYSSYANASLASKEFLTLTRQARWQNLASFTEEEQLKFLAQLCLNAKEFAKQSDQAEIVNIKRRLYSYLEHDIGIEQRALATTILSIIHIVKKDKETEKAACEQELHFILKLLSISDRKLFLSLVALIMKAQGNFGGYVLQKTIYPLSTLVWLKPLMPRALWQLCFESIADADDIAKHNSDSGVAINEKNFSELFTLLVDKDERKREQAVKTLVSLWNKLDDTPKKETFSLLLKWLKGTLFDIQKIIATKVLATLWDQLTVKQADVVLSMLLEQASQQPKHADSEFKALIKIASQLTENQSTIVFNKIVELLEKPSSIEYAAGLLKANFDQLKKEQQTEALIRVLELWRSNKQTSRNLWEALPLIWDQLSDTEKQEVFNELIKVVGIPNAYLQALIIETLLTIQSKTESKLTDEQVKSVLEQFLAVLFNDIRPNNLLHPHEEKRVQGLVQALLILSRENNQMQQDLNNLLSDYRYCARGIDKLKLTKGNSLVEQLKEIRMPDDSLAITETGEPDYNYLALKNAAPNKEDISETKGKLAKQTIELHCMNASSLKELRQLQNALEQARNDPGLAYLVEPPKVFIFSISFTNILLTHQWKSLNSTTNTYESYDCSKEWIDCMFIFQTHMQKYKDKSNNEDRNVMTQKCGG